MSTTPTTIPVRVAHSWRQELELVQAECGAASLSETVREMIRPAILERIAKRKAKTLAEANQPQLPIAA